MALPSALHLWRHFALLGNDHFNFGSVGIISSDHNCHAQVILTLGYCVYNGPLIYATLIRLHAVKLLFASAVLTDWHKLVSVSCVRAAVHWSIDC